MHHVPAEGIAQPDGNHCREQDAGQCRPQTQLPVERKPAQPDQHKADDSRIGRIKIDPCARFLCKPQCPCVQQTGQQRSRPGHCSIDRRKHRHQPGKSRAKPQKHHRFDHPEHRHTGQNCPDAHAQPPQHKHRERSDGRAGRDAHSLPQVHGCPGQPELNGAFGRAAFPVGRPLCTCAFGPAEALCTRQCAHDRNKGQFKADIAHGVAVAGRHQDARRSQ